MNLTPTPRVTFLISTHNRRDVLLRTLERVQECGLPAEDYEIIVVDDASTDGTAAAVRRTCPTARVIRSERNRGACAKNLGLVDAQGQYIIFLDDDSYPHPGSVSRMIEHFDAHPTLGAAIFTVHLTNGAQECSAYPNVFIGCGTGFRHAALRQVGALPEDYFMQAEEYDLSLRLLDAGWEVRRLDDLHVTHLKSPTARRSARTTRLDVRNNLMLALRRLPARWALPFAFEWTRRYRLIARAKGHTPAFWLGCAGGIAQGLRFWKRRPIGAEAFETFARMAEIERRLRKAKEQLALSTVLLLDYGKNLYAYHRACRRVGLHIAAIADNNLGTLQVRYRGIPVITDEPARRLGFDAAIVSNLSPVHARARAAGWPCMTRPVIDLFADDLSAAGPAESESRQTAARSA